ncbi:MAG: nickel-responsive transcriptional regulator NikR [Nitrospiraceae bacterium]|nr:nickel-responsive transcriptional regulator NikR [Nitrospiraceae bacterium]
MGTTRFGISLDEELLRRFDSIIKGKGYGSRSEAIRDLIRDSIVQEDVEEGGGEAVGAIILVYNHETRELADNLTDLQHHFHKAILSSLHVHLDEHNCLEVIVAKGPARDLKSIADRLIGTRGVKHGKLTLTTTGSNLK